MNEAGKEETLLTGLDKIFNMNLENDANGKLEKRVKGKSILKCTSKLWYRHQPP